MVNRIGAVARAALDQYLYLLDEAFAGEDWHSLMSNLKDLAPEDWLWLPPAGARPIAEMVAHLAACKNIYGNHAFADASLTWDDPLANQDVLKEPTAEEIARLVGFLKDAHARLRAQVDALGEDAELLLDHQIHDRARSLSRRGDQPHACATPGERPLGLRPINADRVR